MESVCIAFKAHLGWVNAVAVRVDRKAPTPVHAQRVDFFDGDDRAVSEPYHVAGGWQELDRVPRPADPGAVIAKGHKAQAKCAKKQLQMFRKTLEGRGLLWTRAVMLIGRGIVHENLEDILGSHAHIHVAEGEAIRDATRAALVTLKIDYCDQDEKSILETVAQKTGDTPAGCDDRMKGLKPQTARAWAKEDRVIAWGAWLHRK